MMIALTSMFPLLQFPEADGSIKTVCGATDMPLKIAFVSVRNWNSKRFAQDSAVLSKE